MTNVEILNYLPVLNQRRNPRSPSHCARQKQHEKKFRRQIVNIVPSIPPLVPRGSYNFSHSPVHCHAHVDPGEAKDVKEVLTQLRTPPRQEISRHEHKKRRWELVAMPLMAPPCVEVADCNGQRRGVPTRGVATREGKGREEEFRANAYILTFAVDLTTCVCDLRLHL